MPGRAACAPCSTASSGRRPRRRPSDGWLHWPCRLRSGQTWRRWPLPTTPSTSWRGPWRLCGRERASARSRRSARPKYILRQRGPQGRELAARVGRLSQQRNGQAHPDSGLEDDIGVLFGELEGTESFYSTAAGSATPPRTPAPQGPSASPRPPARPAEMISHSSADVQKVASTACSDHEFVPGMQGG